MRTMKNLTIAVAAVSALGMTAACGNTDPADAQAGDTSSAASEMPSTAPSETPGNSAGDSMADPAADLVGPACADYAKAVPDGAGSVAGMAEDPVAVAAGNNPILTTLTAAVSGQVNKKVNLVDTLNGGEFTVFAPTDDAFAKIPAATLKQLSKPANADALTSILTYHVVAGQMNPDDIAGKTLTTVQGEDLKVSGSGDNLKAQDAAVICGGVHTANATVYLIDSVLMPASMQ